MLFFSGNTLYTFAGAKVNRTISLMCELRVKKNLHYNNFVVRGISPNDITKILSMPKPTGEELAALVPRNADEKQKYCRNLSEDTINADYAKDYLNVEKAWVELVNILLEWGEELPAEVVKPTAKEGAKKLEKYDFRHIQDISNVRKYDTLSDGLNKTFKEYLKDEGYQIEVGAMFDNAPAYAMPINFLLSKNGKKVAILLMEWRKAKRYSIQETEALCRENGVEVLKFYFNLENEKDYVLDRISNAFN